MLKKEDGKIYFTLENGKRRELQEISINGYLTYMDIGRCKRCKCGVLVYWSINDNNRIIETHKAVNGYVWHGDMCLK